MFEKFPVHDVGGAFPALGAGEDADALEFTVEFPYEPLDRVGRFDASSEFGRGFVEEQHLIDVAQEMADRLGLAGPPSPPPPSQATPRRRPSILAAPRPGGRHHEKRARLL